MLSYDDFSLPLDPTGPICSEWRETSEEAEVDFYSKPRCMREEPQTAPSTVTTTEY